ncbi:uncharacterized protein TNCV_4112381 [Trichonephila clavipes]|nr:uncharacterized protein TNCV_4112381 [Trichonephila clavipes]
MKDIQLSSSLSLAIDESCDVKDTAEVALFVRYMSSQSPKEKLLELIPLSGQTRGEDIANAVQKCLEDNKTDLNKIILIATDGTRMDITAKLNERNLKLQGKGNPAYVLVEELRVEKQVGRVGPEMYVRKATKVDSFKRKTTDTQILSFECDKVDTLSESREWSRYWIVAGLVPSSSPVPLKARCVGERCTLNLSRAQTSSRCCGVVVRRGGTPAQVSSTSLDHGSKLRDPSPKALV